jgi:2-oxo-4-hydroxy-4-carboxy-5-ureidoimidazoline decarboxylase
MSGLDRFNEAGADWLRPRLLSLTAAPEWADPLLAGRPFGDAEQLLSRSDELVRSLDESQVDAALAGHPRIGGITRLRLSDLLEDLLEEVEA